MKRITLVSLAWAATIIGVAIAGRTDLLPGDSADALVVTLPALAVVTIGAMSRKSGCGVAA